MQVDVLNQIGESFVVSMFRHCLRTRLACRSVKIRTAVIERVCTMMRFFFDYATQGQSLYDYRGDEFRNVDAAVEHAGAIAENLKHSLSKQWAGWWIEVRNAEGAKLSTVPVPAHIDVAGH
jgi:hypothetical protein